MRVTLGMSWEKFKILFAQHFRVNAEVQRRLQDCDFDLLQYKIQCNDCKPLQFSSSPNTSNNSSNGGSEYGSKNFGSLILILNFYKIDKLKF